MDLASTNGKKEDISVFMVDRDRDSRLDSYGTDTYRPDGSDDDAWQVLWHTSLAIAIKNSGCCNE